MDTKHNITFVIAFFHQGALEISFLRIDYWILRNLLRSTRIQCRFYERRDPYSSTSLPPDLEKCEKSQQVKRDDLLTFYNFFLMISGGLRKVSVGEKKRTHTHTRHFKSQIVIF